MEIFYFVESLHEGSLFLDQTCCFRSEKGESTVCKCQNSRDGLPLFIEFNCDSSILCVENPNGFAFAVVTVVICHCFSVCFFFSFNKAI